MNKRERSSPGENKSEKRHKEEKMFNAIRGLHPNPSDEALLSEKVTVKTVCTDILIKDDNTYLGADITDKDAQDIWTQVFKLGKSAVYGCALIKNKDRTLGINYRLHKPMIISEDQVNFEFELRGSKYKGKVQLPLGPPPKIGEPVVVKIKRHGFRMEEEEMLAWLKLYGEVLGQSVDENSTTAADWKTDSTEVRMILSKHIPSLLPAFGRKMSVLYRGQPILCGACFQLGHVRAKCQNERADWIVFVRDFMRSGIASREMIGRWADIVDQIDTNQKT